MTLMLSPDLLDRRALALLALFDPFGRAFSGPALLTGSGLRIAAKSGGRWAILSAAGLETHSHAFDAPPDQPGEGTIGLAIDVVPFEPGFAPRRFTLSLPRDADPASRDRPGSLFQAVPIPLLPSPRCKVPATASAVRVTVRKRGDGRRVANALVRVASNNGLFNAPAITDAAGEALVIVPDFPPAFTGSGGSVSAELPAKATAVADPATVTLVADEYVAAARASAANRFTGFADPDALADRFPVPASGTAVRLSVRNIAVAEVEWRAPS